MSGVGIRWLAYGLNRTAGSSGRFSTIKVGEDSGSLRVGEGPRRWLEEMGLARVGIINYGLRR